MQTTVSCKSLLLVPVLLASLLSTANGAAHKSARLSVRFLARGTAIYSSFSGNQAEYLIEVADGDKSPFLARLLYRHAQSHPEIPDALVDSGKQQSIRLVRSADCDERYDVLAAAWIPGAFGTLRAGEGLRFISGVTKPNIEADRVLPCFRLSASEVRWQGKHVRVD